MDLTIQVLISTMHQTDFSLLEKMNIQTEAIVINQCDKNEFFDFEYNGHRIKWISLAEHGVGLSRNTALMRATADILLFSDDDVVFCDNYNEIVCSEFLSNPKAGFLTFNLESLNKNREESIDKKKHKIHWYNSLKYGAFRFAIKREIAFKKTLTFSLLLGGGATYQAGEDNLFIVQALQKGVSVWASDKIIGNVAQKESTWFKGYDEKYYFDRGFLFANMFGWKASLLILIFEIREGHKKSNLSLLKRYSLEKKGIKEYRKNETIIGNIK